MSVEFVYDALPGRVVFGVDAAKQLREEADRLGVQRLMLIGSRGHELIQSVGESLFGLVVASFDKVAQHVPAEQAAVAVELAKRCNVDAVVTVGGGSATGFGKAVSLECDVRHLAVPTTYSGSEMTPIWGMTRDGVKQTGSDPRVLPDVVIYDPKATVSLPPEIAGPSGMNALAHAVEATYAPGTNPVVRALALDAIRRLYRSLPLVTADPDDVDARTEALLGAYLAGCTLAVAGTALHHKACHVLGGLFGLGHGEMNAVLLPHALRYNAPAIPSALEDISAALACEDAPRALYDLALSIGTPASLASIGMPKSGIEPAAAAITERAAANVRRPDVVSIRAMLETAFVGRPPEG